MQGRSTRREVKQQVYLDTLDVLASCTDKCGRCYIVLGVFSLNHHINDCPAAMAMTPHYRARLSILAVEPLEEIMPCIHDFGYHAAEQCPWDKEPTLSKLKAVGRICSHCWLADDRLENFITHSAGGEAVYGGDKCRNAHGRDFIRDAVYALFHARPEYVAHHMRDSEKWNRVPKRSDHPCVSYAGGELTPTDMPSLDDFALWAKARWDQSMAVSNGVVLLLHYMRFTNGGTLARLRDHDYKYWKTLCMIGRLRTGI